MNSESNPNDSQNAGDSVSSFPPEPGAKTSIAAMIGKLFLLVIVLVLGAAGVLYAIGGNEMEFVVQQEFTGKKGETYKLTPKIYRMVTDPEMVKKWVDGVKKIEPIGDIKDHRVGARSKITVESEGQEIVFEDEVISAKKNLETELKMTSEYMDVRQKFEIDYKDQAALSGDKVVLTHTFKVRCKGMSRFFAIFVRSSIEQKLKDNLATMKKLVEDGVADQPQNNRPQNRGKGRPKAKKSKRPKADK